MPQLPRYESKGQLTTQQPSFMAAESTEGKVMEKAAEATGKIAPVVSTWAKEVNSMRLNQAQYNLKAKVLEISSRAELDPDINNRDRYIKEIDDAYKENNNGFTDPKTRAEADITLGYESNVAKIKLDSLFKKKLLSQQRATTSDKALLLTNNPATDESEIDSLFDSDLSRKLFTPEELQKLKVDNKKDLRMNKFINDFRNDPKGAENKFGVAGEGYGFTLEEGEKARSKMKEIKRMNLEAQTENVANASLQIFNGELTERQIDDMIEVNKVDASQGVTEKQGMTLKAALYRDIKSRIGAKEFAKQRKSIDYIFSDSQQNKMTMYEAVLNAYKDGITGEESNFLKKIADLKKDVTFAKEAAAGKKFMESLFGARPKNIEYENQMMLAYAKRISDGMNPLDASRKTALDIIVKDHPAVVGDPDIAGTFSPTKGFRPVQKVKRDESSPGKGR